MSPSMAAAEKLSTIFLALIIALFLYFPAASGLARRRRIPSALIRKINSEGPYLGLITTFPPEENAFFASGAFKNHSKYPYVDLAGRRFRVGTIQGQKAIYVKSGIGMANAAAATQQMLDMFNIKGLIHFGISGNTNSSLHIGDVSIPLQFANTGLWDWLKPNATVPSNDAAKLDFESYNVPQGGSNSLGRIGYSPEQFYSESGDANVYQEVLWFGVSKKWLRMAAALEGMELEQCVNSSVCLENKPKVVVGLKGSTADAFVDNGDYRDFLFRTFGVSSTDMESCAVVMTSLSNGFPVIVIRGLSDLAGAQDGANQMRTFGPLAASNAAKVVIQFVNLIPKKLNK